MDMADKVNPRRIPRTQADVERAYRQGQLDGFKFLMTNILWILVDKHDAPAEDIHTLNKDVDYLLDSIIKGYVSFADIERYLDKEYDWRFSWREEQMRKML